MHNDQEHNSKKIFGLLKHGAGGVTLGLGTSSLILVVTTAIALVAVATTAWLASNREVDSGSMAELSNDTLFELAVPDTNSRKTDQVTDNSWTPGSDTATGVITEGMLETLAAQYARGEADIVTNENQAGVVCVLKADGAIKSIRPGSTGTLTFLIKPKKAELDFKASLNIAALGKKLVPDNNNSVSLTYERLPDALTENDSRADAFNYLKGHVLFFTKRSAAQDANGYYSYTSGQRILPGQDFYITGATQAVSSNFAGYTVTLYWEWPVTYDRLEALLGSAELNGERKAWYFVKDANDQCIVDSYGYNTADTEIGKHISHIFAEIPVEVPDSVPNGVTTVVLSGS